MSRSYTYTKASPTGQDQDVDLRRTATDQNGAVTTYGYDAVNRLCSVYAGTTTSVGCTAPAGATTYAYDPSGNRTATRNPAGAVTSYGYNDANQLCWKAAGAQTGSACPAPAGATTYAYDPNGNLTSSSAGFSATVNDARNQTTSMTAPGQFPTTFAYADVGQDERTVAGSSSFLNGLLGVGSGAFGAYFTREPNGSLVSMRSGSTSLYYTTDALGSVVALTADNGTYDFAIYTYDAYGNLTSPPPTGMGAVNPWRFAGGYFDKDTGLYKFGARYYDATLGRWTQQDPSGQDANSYAYVGGDPVNSVDPTGLSFWSDVGGAIGAGAFATIGIALCPATAGIGCAVVAGGLGGALGGGLGTKAFGGSDRDVKRNSALGGIGGAAGGLASGIKFIPR